jgi:hypothetical protein
MKTSACHDMSAPFYSDRDIHVCPLSDLRHRNGVADTDQQHQGSQHQHAEVDRAVFEAASDASEKQRHCGEQRVAHVSCADVVRVLKAF